MTRRLKASLEARKNRLRRRIRGTLGESLGAFGLLAVVTVLALGFIYAYSCVLSAPYFEINEVTVRGLNELDRRDILRQARIPQGQNLLALQTDAVAKRVAENPWVRHVRVGREFPDRLVLEVSERKPVALIKEKNEFFLLDAQGVVFKKLSKEDNVDLAIITGMKQEDLAQSGLLAEALALLGWLDQAQYQSLLGTVSEVKVDEVFGLSLLTDKGLFLKMGMHHYEQKLEHLEQVLKDLERRDLARGHIFIDVADMSSVTVRHQETVTQIKPNAKRPQYRI